MIYIVIPVHNRMELTRECLTSLKRQDSQDFSVVVVDDGSTDGTSEMIRSEFPDTILLFGDGNLWWAGSINRGIRYILNSCKSEDYILTLNDDLIVLPEYISALMKAAKLNPSTIIGSVETTMNQTGVIKSGGISVNWKTAKVTKLNRGKRLEEFPVGYSVNVSRLTGRGTLFPVRVFKEVGLYDEAHIKHCADTELPLRANFKFAYPLIVSYDAVVISALERKGNINNKISYTLFDVEEYFFGIRSHFNLKNRFWLAYNVAPNNFWFIRYLLLDLIRTVGHFVIRFSFRPNR